MTKKRAIISYDKLTIDQKKQILKDYPDGYINHLTTIKIPTGEILEALIWETDEIIYLVKISKTVKRPVVDDDDDDDDFEEDKFGKDDDDLEADEEEEVDYDKPEKEAEGEDGED